MRQFLFQLFFGADEIAKRMFNLFTLREAAIKQHAENKALMVKLKVDEGHLYDLKTAYDDNRVALETAYRLELD